MARDAEMTDRRAVIVGLSAMATSAGWANPAAAQTGLSDIGAVLKTLVGDAVPVEGRIALDLPEIAENGNTVPYAIRVDSPMTDAQYVKAVHLLAPANPLPRVASFFFTPQSGKASVASRMRLAQTQEVLAIAAMSDGTFYMHKRPIKVTVGGCGG